MELDQNNTNPSVGQEGENKSSEPTVVSSNTVKPSTSVGQVTQINTSEEGPVSNLPASAVGRMMGLATANELKILESKIDLFGTKITNLGVRLDSIKTTLANAPTGADLERIDVQIGALRNLIKEVMGEMAGEVETKKSQGQKKEVKITSNNGPE